MKLKNLLNSIEYKILQGDDNIYINHISYDSRKVKENTLFICIKGFNVDGHKFALDAIKKGAVAIVVEEEIKDIPKNITVICTNNTRKAMAYIAAKFYNEPLKNMKLIGVTGTNGKTTTTFLIGKMLEEYNKKIGLIGTIENRIGKIKIEAKRTTPESLDLQALFSQMLKEEVSHVVMEVSSHALELHRVDACDFEIGIFTNLTLDHLDFHKTMENYRNAKAKLFKKCKYGIINIDDPHAEEIIKQATCKIITFGIEKEADFKAYNISMSSKGIKFSIILEGKEIDFQLKTIGRFNIYNALGAIAAGYYLNIPIEVIKKALEDMEGVPGRVQSIRSNKGFDVIVDYAHAPDGLENVLKTIKEFAKGNIITVFGCGGDRDRSKRPIMGEIAGNYSDYCIITSDNPRSEDPEFIIKEVEVGMKKTNCPYKKIVDRREGIKEAINKAQKDDIILIAGKGHENYQILKDKVIHFDDVEEVKTILQGENTYGKNEIR
ncbi:UDP-N-acetylmuramoyl-L-alanyl-D-glutamate--2,6-diaminopimelate ligase [Defluviitalea phaphyphila]|uniref:UDP-N-acetylmuramoyl-L-alanyl-D-glutamate--2, 6-diaminopimelate ligase n=1 Tax=Defluviitalea phaphyphila TaxID=1473580 RepID=UPI0007310674|nr:UDP-N-acetylmuramoyl-L-alanyl-D-glutamate--2,6-diaminopimelate ligase [Defluviitalea phaphyphila]